MVKQPLADLHIDGDFMPTTKSLDSWEGSVCKISRRLSAATRMRRKRDQCGPFSTAGSTHWKYMGIKVDLTGERESLLDK